MSEDQSSRSEPVVSSLTEHQEWLISFSSLIYEHYSKIESINDRIRTLTAPMTALVIGYIYQTSNFTYHNSATDALLFYLPMGIGSVCVISSIFLMLWSLVIRHSTEVLADPKEILKSMPPEKNLSRWTIEKQVIHRRIDAADKNLRNLKDRGNLIRYGAILAIIAFLLLLISSPLFIVNQLTN